MSDPDIIEEMALGYELISEDEHVATIRQLRGVILPPPPSSDGEG